MTHHTDAELLPCPFCNSEDIRDTGNGYVAAFCYECEAEGPGAKDWMGAAEKWNLRAPASRSQVVPWLRVIDEAMVNAHLGVAVASDDYATAKKKLNSLTSWEIDVSKYFDTAASPEAASTAKHKGESDGE